MSLDAYPYYPLPTITAKEVLASRKDFARGELRTFSQDEFVERLAKLWNLTREFKSEEVEDALHYYVAHHPF